MTGPQGETADEAAGREGSAQGAAGESALRILVVEDEVLIALELECLLEDLGHVTVGVAVSRPEAVALGRAQVPDVAFVDVHLVDGPTGIDVARALSEDPRISVVFMTANTKRIPDDYAGALGAIAKPYSERVVGNVLAFLAARKAGRDVTPPPMEGFSLAPHARA